MNLIEKTEEELRSLLSQRPQNGRIMAYLANLLAAKLPAIIDGDHHSDVTSQQIRIEALQFAQGAIDIAPSKPFGYHAMSLIHESFAERMKMLSKAIDRCSTDPAHAVHKICLQTRLLLDPQEEEARLIASEKVGKTSNLQPRRRTLTASEEELYHNLESALENVQRLALNEKELSHLGLVHYKLGFFFRKRCPSTLYQPRSIVHFDKSRQLLPNDNVYKTRAEFWLATLTRSTTLFSRCPPDYVAGLYANFAHKFDETLVHKLQYKTPSLLRQLLQDTLAPDGPFKKGLDLGCGTGLSGKAFEDCVDSLVGVDISPEMIVKARARGCYNELVQGDIENEVDEFVTNKHRFSLIIACDVFVYFGRLEGLFRKISQCLPPSGLFLFSTELLLDAENGGDFVLQECARFSHSSEYICSILHNNCNMKILATKIAVIRKNKGRDVEGLLVICTKREAPT